MSGADADPVAVALADPRRAFIIGTVLAAALILLNANGSATDAAFSDGLIYRYVAANLDAAPEEVHEVVAERGTSLRYGRIGLPITLWLASAGQPGAIPWAHVLIMSLAGGLAAAAAALLFRDRGPLAEALPFLVPGFVLSLVGGYAEAVAVAAVLWGVVAVRAGRIGWAWAAFAYAFAARENAAFIILGVAVWLVLRRRVMHAAVLATTAVPTFIWYLVVRARFGHLPPLDPYLRETTDTVGLPLIAVFDSLVDAAGGKALMMAVLHIVLVAAAIRFARVPLFGTIAVVASLQILTQGPFAYRFVGEAARTSTLIQLFVLLAIVAARRTAPPATST